LPTVFTLHYNKEKKCPILFLKLVYSNPILVFPIPHKLNNKEG
jgi:hypothetical protein